MMILMVILGQNGYKTCSRTLGCNFSQAMLTTGELGYDGPLYDGFSHMSTDDMLRPSPMHIKYSSYVYDRFCI